MVERVECRESLVKGEGSCGGAALSKVPLIASRLAAKLKRMSADDLDQAPGEGIIVTDCPVVCAVEIVEPRDVRQRCYRQSHLRGQRCPRGTEVSKIGSDLLRRKAIAPAQVRKPEVGNGMRIQSIGITNHKVLRAEVAVQSTEMSMKRITWQTAAIPESVPGEEPLILAHIPVDPSGVLPRVAAKIDVGREVVDRSWQVWQSIVFEILRGSGVQPGCRNLVAGKL